MYKKLLGSCVFVIAIIMSSSFSTVVSDPLDNDSLVEYSVTFFGLDYEKTIFLTKGDLTSIEALIDEFRVRLSHVTTKAQVKEIFTNMIVNLDQYGLFGDMDTEQVQRFVTEDCYHHLSDASSKHFYTEKTVENGSNALCLIAGHTYFTIFESNIARIISKPTYVLLALQKYAILHNRSLLLKVSTLLVNPLKVALFGTFALSTYNPLPISCTIGLGDRGAKIIPASGWVTTIGLNGAKSWNGSFYGQLMRLPILITLFDGGIVYPGVSGFTGIQWTEPGSMECFYLGTALHVKIGSEIPYDYYPF